MAYKFFYLYLVAAIIAFVLAGYRMYAQYPAIHNIAILYFIPSLLLFYLAYKSWHEKQDQEMM